jgi:membrane-bound lytic murein transglycosylase D
MLKLKSLIRQYRSLFSALGGFLLGVVCILGIQKQNIQVQISANQAKATQVIKAGSDSILHAAFSSADDQEIVEAESEDDDAGSGNNSLADSDESGAAGSSDTEAGVDSEGFQKSTVTRAVPFWQNEEAEEIFNELHLSEILNIEDEVKPQISDATPDRILSDFDGRIAPEFEVPELIFNQTKFWFRVYTEFDSNKKIIHDSLHPHIIYDIVDISGILAQPARASWLNVVKAQKAVTKRVAEIRSQLKKMARKKKEDMTSEELGWLAQFEGIKGNQKKIILTSAQSLRVQTGQKDFFEGALSTSGLYLEGMEAIFKSKNLPVELTRLPFVESSFVIGATSKVGAAGIWQFMPTIGRQFMRVNDQVDERRSPWKATEAAAKLLKENYTILHKKWGLALTAYNHGPGGVRKAMERTGSKDIARIVRSYRSKNFDFASANFFTCFLAALHAQSYRELIWPDRQPAPALIYDSIALKRSMRPHQLVKITGLSDEEILLYNPELDRSFRRNYVIPKGYRLFLPSEAKFTLQKPIAAVKPANKTSAVD